METFKWVVGITILVVSFVVLLFWGGYQLDKYSCTKLEQNTGIETKYSFWGGSCLVKVNDRFIPQEN